MAFTDVTKEAAPVRAVPRRWWRRGAAIGFRTISFIVGPICAVVVGVGVAITAVGLAAGRGWSVPGLVPGPFVGFLGLAALGTALGAIVGSICGLIQLALPRRSAPVTVADASKGAGLVCDDEVDVGDSKPRLVRFLRRHWRWFVGFALFWPVSGLVIGAYLGRTVDRRLAIAIAAADRDDPFWRLDDLMAHREPVPDEENSALVVASVLSTVPDDWPGKPAPAGGSRPTVSGRAFDAMGATPDNRRLSDGVVDTLGGELQKYQEAVKIARTIAGFARGRHELELGPTLIDTPLSETQQTRAVARLLEADAAIRAHDGEMDGALDSCCAIFGVGRSIGDEPFLISALVRMAISEVALQSIRRVLAQGEPSDRALSRVQTAVDLELARPTLLDGMKGERAVYSEIIRRIREGEMPISALSARAVALDPGAPHGAMSSWGKLMFDNQLAVALEWLNDAVAIARLQAAGSPSLWAKWDEKVIQTLRSRFGFITATLPLLLSPAVSAAGASDARVKCELGATAILLAAERHRRKIGAWPAAIASIDHAFLPTAPVDPFSGGMFRMEHRDGQLFIYSIGPNRKDEHGAFDRKRYQGGGPDDFGTSGWDVSMRRQPAPPFEDAGK